jgi:hypothetical protein
MPLIHPKYDPYCSLWQQNGTFTSQQMVMVFPTIRSCRLTAYPGLSPADTRCLPTTLRSAVVEGIFHITKSTHENMV